MLFPKYTYLISNRSTSDPNGTIGPLTYHYAPNNMDRPYKSSGFSVVPSNSWMTSLTQDLATRYQGSAGPVDIMFYIHGYATSGEYAKIGLEGLGLGLTSVGIDRGILVGVSWPSNTWTYGEAQSNAAASGALLTACGNVIIALRSILKTTVRATLFCHSMGNYLLGSTLAAKTGVLPPVDSIFMLAADIDYAIWSPGTANYAQGVAIQKAAKQMYVLYTANDTVLRDSGWVNWDYRLGYFGAKSPNTLPANVAQFDYSAYGNDPYCNDYVPYSYYNTVAGTGALVHSSSKFIPDLLSFEAHCLQNVPAGSLNIKPTRDLAALKSLVTASSNAGKKGSKASVSATFTRKSK